MSELVRIQLPFSGFYESIHDREIDYALESGFNYDYEKEQEKEVPDIWGADIDYKAIRKEYCEHYVDAFADRFSLTLAFDSVASPRFYNFETDQIFALIPREEIDKIRKQSEEDEKWPQYIHDNFSDASGFLSNYSNHYQDEDWTRETLDACQYLAVIQFWLNEISPKVGIQGWPIEESYLLDNFEMCNWSSIVAAHEKIEEYLKSDEFAELVKVRRDRLGE